MIATITAIFFSYWAIALLSVFLIFFSYKDYKNWSLFFIPILGISVYGLFNLEPIFAAKCVAAYLPIGVLWSFWRWKRHGDDVMKGVSVGELNDRQKSVLIEELTPRYNVDKISSWIIAWPFSAISHIFSDIIALVSKVIREYLIEIYSKISGKHLKELNKEPF